MAAVWPGLRAVEQSVLLSQTLVSGARPVPDRMGERAEDGFTTATSIATAWCGAACRSAPRTTRSATPVRRAVDAGSTDLAAWLDGAALAPAQVVDDLRYGGGPGAFDEPFERAIATWRAHRQWQPGLAGRGRRRRVRTGRRRAYGGRRMSRPPLNAERVGVRRE